MYEGKKARLAAVVTLLVYYVLIYAFLFLEHIRGQMTAKVQWINMAAGLIRFRLLVHTLFIIASWALSYQHMKSMIAYMAKRSIAPFIAMISYLIAVLVFLDQKGSIIEYSEVAKLVVQPMVGIAIFFMPRLFTKEKITNPSETSKKGIQLESQDSNDLPINNPQAGVLITGLPGCGKTKYLIEPLLYKMIQKGYTGIVYDYDFNAIDKQGDENYCLSQLVYNCNRMLETRKKRFININFQNIQKSAQVNPIASQYIKDRAKLSQYVYTFLSNLSPELSNKNDFWIKNTSALLESIIIYLDNNYKPFCTIPHAILMGLQDIKQLITLVCRDKEAKLYASPILDALKGSKEQLAGVTANFKVALKSLLNKNIFWALSDDQVPLVVNDKEGPTLLTIGNDPTGKDIYSPIIAMIISVVMSNMYSHDREKSFLVLDELPTLFIPSLANIPATARKYGIATVAAIQNQAQLEKRYGTIGARELVNTFANHIIGKSSYRESKLASDMLGQYETEKSATTFNNKQSAVSQTVQKQRDIVITPQETMGLKVGEFVGQVTESNNTFFRTDLKPISKYNKKLTPKHFKPLPVCSVNIDVEKNFKKIQSDIEVIFR